MAALSYYKVEERTNWANYIHLNRSLNHKNSTAQYSVKWADRPFINQDFSRRHTCVSEVPVKRI